MRKIFFIFLFLSTVFAPQIFAKSTQDVLLIQSYHKGYKWSDEISKVFDERFGNSKNIFLTTIYMDTKKVATPEYFEKLFALYQEQFKTRNFDVIVVADNYALEFFEKYHARLFGNTPMVFLGINDFNIEALKKAKIDKISTGVVEQVDIEKNIKLILKLHPKVSKILIISDRSKTSLSIKRNILQVLPKYTKELSFEYIDNIEIEKLKQKVRSLPSNTVILWGLLFRDKTGKYFTHKESLHVIKQVANVPIYGLWDFYLGEGIVGGLLTSAKAQASVALKLCEKILQGENPAKIPIVMKSPNRYIFDYNELERFHIKIPKDISSYEVINKPFSFYEKYQKYVLGSIIIFCVLVFIVFILTYNILHRMRSEEALKSQLEFINVLLDSVQNPINYKNLKGEYIGCNNAFANLVGTTKEALIGKTADTILPKEWYDEGKLQENEILHNGESQHFEKSLHLKNGQVRLMSCSKTVFRNSTGMINGTVNVMVDMTEINQQKQFIIQQSKLAEMGEMVAAIAHQWNEPLVELSAILQDLEFSYNNEHLNAKEMKGFVNESMAQIQYMSQTLKDFRNFLKPSTEKNLFNAKQALKSVLEILGKHIFYSYIKLHVKIEKSDISVYGYENEFKQVLLNIINNAKQKIIKFKKQGNIYIHLETDMQITRFKIADDAGLIEESVIEFIFDPFYTTHKEGTGLGLYMAKVIIEDKMKGKIWAQNLGDKVEFIIEVPNQKIE